VIAINSCLAGEKGIDGGKDLFYTIHFLKIGDIRICLQGAHPVLQESSREYRYFLSGEKSSCGCILYPAPCTLYPVPCTPYSPDLSTGISKISLSSSRFYNLTKRIPVVIELENKESRT
jgi:hypothetical protein